MGLNWGQFPTPNPPPPATYGNVWRHFLVGATEGVLLASSGYRPGMLVNILQHTEPFTKYNHPVPNANSAEVGKPRHKEI